MLLSRMHPSTAINRYNRRTRVSGAGPAGVHDHLHAQG